MSLLNLRVRTRIAIAMASVVALLLCVSLLSVFNAAHNSEAVRAMKSSNMNLVNAQNAMWELRFGVANFMTGSPEARQKILGDEAKWSGIVKQSLQDYGSRALSKEETGHLDDLRATFDHYMSSRPTWFELYSSGKTEEAAEWRAKNTNKFGAASVKGFKTLIELQQANEEIRVTAAIDANERYRNWLLAIAATAVVLAVVIGIALTRSITAPLHQALELAGAVSRGDLTTELRVRSNDEVGQLMRALETMNANLRGIVSEVRHGTEAIASASSQIASGNQELSHRTEQQSGALQEAASSIEQLTSTVKQNADNARQANQLALTASDIVIKGNSVVSQVVSTMSSINDSSSKIVDIISVIDGIAFQTNILALNAAVEAARAGEQGRGFAVVASEVRNLAQRSASAAKEIKTLIGDSVDKVGSGTVLVNEAGATMNEILASVKRVTDIMAEIMSATTEQSAGIEQVNRAVGDIDQGTQQNAALVEQAAAAAGELKDQAERLARSVAVFKLAPQGSVPRLALG